MSVPIRPIFDAILSHASASGWYEQLNGHEPKSKPKVGSGLAAALWVQRIGPVPAASGLATTTGRLELTLRIYGSMLSEPQDDIDLNMIDATDAMLAAYSGDFEVGGNVRNIDLLGATGAPLGAQAGYLSQDGKLFRVMDLCVPLVINDLWTQNA